MSTPRFLYLETSLLRYSFKRLPDFHGSNFSGFRVNIDNLELSFRAFWQEAFKSLTKHVSSRFQRLVKSDCDEPMLLIFIEFNLFQLKTI